MNRIKIALLLSAIYISDTAFAQRGFYSGARPQGYKDNFVPKIETTINNRFDSQPTVNTPDGRVPVNANNDIYLVNYLASLPREKQPFWFINYQLLEAQRGQPFPAPTQGVNTQTLTQTANRSPFLGSAGSSSGSQTGVNNNGQNTVFSNRFDGQGTSGVYQPPLPEGQRLGPFRVIVGVPPSSANSLF